MNNADLRGLATDRRELHIGHASQRPLSHDYEMVGLVGERALARFAGTSVDGTRRPRGDGGTDTVITAATPAGPRQFTVDIKTARKPFNLLVEVGKVRAELFILAGYIDNGEAELLGWAWAATVRAAPTANTGGMGVISHTIPRGRLRPMMVLSNRIIDPIEAEPEDDWLREEARTYAKLRENLR